MQDLSFISNMSDEDVSVQTLCAAASGYDIS